VHYKEWFGDKMKDNTMLIYAVCTSIFIIGLVTTLSWSYTSRWFGLLLLLISLIIMYYINRKEQNDNGYNQISLERSSLGFLLIFIDIAYNLIMKDGFRYFDYGIISSGLIIILLNINHLKFLRLDEQKISFSTYFIFITVLLYGFSFEGLDILLKSTGTASNPFWDWFSINVVSVAIPILNFIKPTVSDGAIINFDSFTVSVGYACSGIESISVFFSAVIAYFVSVKEYDVIRVTKYLLIGGILLYIVNLLRIIIIIVTGYYYGISTMMFVHTHLGWIFFVLSMTVFWYLVFNEKHSVK
jgi:archaeosortase C (PEF-CTERM variant)